MMTYNPENLLKLAEYLETLPADYEHFEMEEFLSGGDETKYAVYAAENGGVFQTCGAAACAIGHGPTAGFLFLKDEITIQSSYKLGIEIYKPNWVRYCDRVFISRQDHPDAWDFMFGGQWTYVDNTPWGAAGRIRFFLANASMGEDFFYDLDTDEEIYADYVKEVDGQPLIMENSND